MVIDFLCEMDSNLAKWDAQLSLMINQFQAPWADPIMVLISEKWVWMPLYALLVFWLYQNFQFRGFLIRLVALGAAVALSDQTASALLKARVMRLRPCHEPDLMNIWHIPNGCGGLFGFASSHAANAFCLAFFMFLVSNGKPAWARLLFVWAFLIAWSRIYLAAHYLGDVLAGALIGIFWSAFIYWLLKNRRWILTPG